MNQPYSSDPSLQSAKRIIWLLFLIGVASGLGVLLLKWLKLFDAEGFWSLVFWPLMIPCFFIHCLIERHEENCQSVARCLAHTRLLPPSFGQSLAARLTDWLIWGSFVFLPGVLSFAQIFEWASHRAVAEKAWVFWTLALAAVWIGLAVGSNHVYFHWLPTTRLQAWPGLWLLGLRMTDLEGHRLTRGPRTRNRRRTRRIQMPRWRMPPAYLIVRRPPAGTEQSPRAGIEK